MITSALFSSVWKKIKKLGLSEAPIAKCEASLQVVPMENFFCLWFSDFPLSRAEHRRGGRTKARGLFERSEFPRAPVTSTTRRMKRDTGVFFCFVFFHVEENEEIFYEKLPGSEKPLRVLHLKMRV
jgi:hypothetical protein